MKSTITKMPEILSPAGNLEKLKFAVTYGANAVYCALDKFGMRASADNFTLDELDEGIDFAHKRGVKVYLTVNTMPHECNMAALPEFLAPLKKITPDAFIVADIGVMQTIKKIIPD
ncbi:MAG: peptidase U32 family protein, partial [Clostridia bacterium]